MSNEMKRAKRAERLLRDGYTRDLLTFSARIALCEHPRQFQAFKSKRLSCLPGGDSPGLLGASN